MEEIKYEMNVSKTIKKETARAVSATYTIDASVLPFLKILGLQFHGQQKDLKMILKKVQTLKTLIKTTTPENRDDRWYTMLEVVLERLSYDVEYLKNRSKVMEKEQKELINAIRCEGLPLKHTS